MQATTRQAIDFAMRHTAEMAWLEANVGTNSFAASLAADFDRHGKLTDNQLAAVRRGLGRAAAEQAAPTVEATGVGEIERRFDVARGNLIKRPALRLDTFVFKAAPSTGQNPGAIYVTDEASGLYLGKVMGAKFVRAADCTADQSARIVAAASDPSAAAEAYGRRTGNCSVCGRELTAEESLARFIGPICIQKMGL